MPRRCWMRFSLFYVALVALAMPAASPPRAFVDALGDPLPPGAVARYGTVRLRHHDGVHWLGFTSDGKRLVSAGGHELRLWDVTTGKRLAKRPIPLYSGGGDVALAPGGDGVYQIGMGALDYYPGWKSPRQRVSVSEHQSLMFAVLSPDGNLLAGSAADGVLLIEVPSGRIKAKLQPPPDEPKAIGALLPQALPETETSLGLPIHLAFSRDGKFLAQAVIGGQVVLWDVANGKHVRVYPAKECECGSSCLLAFSPDDRFLAAQMGGRLRMLPTTDDKDVPEFTAPSDPMSAIRFSDDGKELLAVKCQRPQICRFEARTGKLIATSDQVSNSNLSGNTATFSPDGKMIAVWNVTNIHLIDVKSGKELFPQLPGREGLGLVRWKGDEIHCLTATNEIRTWEPMHGRQLRAVGFDERQLDLHPNGRRVAERTQHGLRVVKPGAKQSIWQIPDIQNVYQARFTPDGRWLGVCDYREDGLRFELFDADTGKRRHTLRKSAGGDLPTTSIVFSPRSDLAACLDNDEVSVHDVETGKVCATLDKLCAQRAAFSPDNRLLAILTSDGVVAVHRLGEASPVFEVVVQANWGAARGGEEPRQRLPFEFGPIAFSPDGQCLVAASGAHVRVWDLTGRPIAVLRGHEGAVSDLAFSPDGTRLVSVSNDGTGLVWDVAALSRTRRTVDRRGAGR